MLWTILGNSNRGGPGAVEAGLAQECVWGGTGISGLLVKGCECAQVS